MSANARGRTLWLATTELWERFTFYGLRAILVLHLVAAPAAGGFGVSDAEAAAVYGLFAATVYLSALPGGVLADRVLGPVRAIWVAGGAMLLGNMILSSARGMVMFGFGLALVALGAGTLKASIVPMVARAAQQEGRSLDGALTLFYVGINVGGVGGPLLAAGLAQKFGWWAGYAIASAGMGLALVTYSRVAPHLAEPGDALRRPSTAVIATLLLAALLISALVQAVPPTVLIRGVLGVVVLCAVGGFIYLHRHAADARERANVRKLAGLFCGAVVFWAAGEQAGVSLTLFAQRFTDRSLGGLAVPAAWFQSLNPAYVVVLAPLFAVLWLRLGRRGTEPDAVAKFAAGLIAGGGALAIAAAGAYGAGGAAVSPLWLVATYLLLAVGEIFLSPIGLGAAARFAPASHVALATGLWFLSLGFGGLLAGLTGSLFDLGSARGFAAAFGSIAAILASVGVIFMIMARRTRVTPASVD